MVVVIFPKISCYENKDLDTQRIYRAKFNEYLKLLVDSNCKVEYFLEDTLARKILESYPTLECTPITAMAQDDFVFFKEYKELLELGDDFYNNYSNARNIGQNIKKTTSVPMSLLIQNKEEYIKQKVELCRKHMRSVTDMYIKNKNSVLMFRTNSNQDRCTALRDTIYQGDGRLCIEVDINSNMVVTYYGGVFVPEDYIPNLLRL